PELGRARRGNSDPYIKAPTREQQAELDRIDDQIKAASAAYTKLEPVTAAAENAWLKSLTDRKDYVPKRGITAYYSLDGNLRGEVEAPKNGRPTPQASWKGNAQFGKGIVGQAANFDGSSFIDAGEIGGFEDNTKATF